MSTGKIKSSRHASTLNLLLQRTPGYMPNWLPEPSTKAHALLDVLARYHALLDGSAAELPVRNRLAMLDMLGVPLLPAQAARVPVVFELMPGSRIDVTVAADSQLAAQAPAPAPSPLDESPAAVPAPILFFTERTVTLARAKLAALYSVDPETDTYADHASHRTDGFTAFDEMGPTEHAIYLGHDTLFKLGGKEIVLLLQCTLDQPAQKPLDVNWQYLSESGWVTLQRLEEEDTTRFLTRSGQIALRLQCGPEAKKETLHGRTSYWLRGTLKTPIIRGENLRQNPLTVNNIGVRVQFKKKGLLPEVAFADTVRQDVSKHFYPFGEQPATHSTFYLASNEVFQRGGARVQISIEMDPHGTPSTSTTLTLVWEYFGSGGWRDIKPEGDGTSYQFSVARKILSFNCPREWQECEVNGVKNRWLRVRITAGRYNTIASATVGATGSATIPVVTNNHPPVIKTLKLAYTYLTDPAPIDHCLIHNNFLFKDHSDDAIWSHRTFDPFWPLQDVRPALYFGFDQPLPAGLVSLYAHIPGAEEQEPGSATNFVWEYLARDGWLQLGVLDESNDLHQSGMVQFIGPSDAVASEGLGGSCYRVRARLKDNLKLFTLPVTGIWLNAVWAVHRVRIEQEMLGMADGTPRQALRFSRTPVLPGETIEIREWSGTGEGWQIIAQQLPEEDLRYERDPLSQRIRAVWVRWYQQPHLYEAQSHDRVYVLERATGLLRFGDGSQGMIPPGRSRIVSDYTSGGGAAGNVPAQSITQLRSAVPMVASVSNPVAAAGGADTETVQAVLARGAQTLRHRDRAITPSDIEWVAHDASPEVARAHCLAITGVVGHAQRGWFTVIVVPLSLDKRPQPTAGLQRLIAAHLRKRVPASVVRRLQVVEPSYIELKIIAEIVPRHADQAARVESSLRQRLDQFLHPLAGRAQGDGWGFGESVHLSQIAALIESTEGVDYAHSIRLYVDGCEQSETVAVPRDALLCSGEHELKLTVGVR